MLLERERVDDITLLLQRLGYPISVRAYGEKPYKTPAADKIAASTSKNPRAPPDRQG